MKHGMEDFNYWGMHVGSWVLIFLIAIVIVVVVVNSRRRR